MPLHCSSMVRPRPGTTVTLRPLRGGAPTFAVGLLLGVLALAAPGAHAATYYVSPCGSDAWVGLSPNCLAPLGPKRTLQAALAVANDGDEILVAPGVYPGPIDLDGKAVHLRGLAGAAATFIHGNGLGPVVLCNSAEGPDTILEGFTVTGGASATHGGGMLIALASPTVVDCAFVANTAAQSGGGVRVVTGSPTFLGCTFSGNVAGNLGGGVSTNFGLPSFVDCLFQGNVASFGGGVATSGGSPSFEGCTIADNEADGGGGMHLSAGSPEIVGCTIEDNAATFDGAGILAIGAALALAESTFVGNEALGDGGGLSVLGGAAEVEQCLFTQNAATFGGGVSGGSGAMIDLVACDILANDATSSSGGISVQDTDLLVFGGSISENTATSVGGLGAFESAVTAFGVTFAENQGAFAGGAVGIGAGSAVDALFQLCLFADNLGGIAGGGIFLIDAAATVQTCTFTGNAAGSGGAVASESNAAAGTLLLRDSQFLGNLCNLGGGAIFLDEGVSIDALRCRFEGNTSLFSNGGAVAVFGADARFVSCDFIGNSAEGSGGAIQSSSALLLANCLLAANVAGDRGGALSHGGSPAEIASTTITGNSAGIDGGAMWTGGAVAIANSIVWSNSTPSFSGPQLPEARYSIVPATVAGPGCFNANPVFAAPAADNYRLAAGSPALDVGQVWLLPSDALDADGDGDFDELLDIDRDGAPRTALSAAAGAGGECGLVLDLGAFERPGGAAPLPAAVGDLDHDGTVGPADLGLVLAAWGDDEGCPAADLNGDGLVDGADLALVLANWG